MEPVTGALIGAAATLVTGAYVNAKFSIGKDIQTLKWEAAWGKRMGKRIQDLGDTCTIYNMFTKADPSNEFLWFEGRTWTYDVDKLAALLEAKGVSRKDYIAVFTTNSPEMIMTILALSKLGAIAALINISLRDSGSFGRVSLPSGSDFLIKLADLPVPAVVSKPAKATIQDLSVLIYTSGTTGKPKACAIRNHLMMVTSTPLSQDLEEPEKYFPLRIYSPLPLFHGTAIFTCLSYALGTSSAVCLARKFSTSRFWKDVTESRATRILYVGELCRYLVHSPLSPYDRGHNCIVAAGNGLRGEIWEKFKERFGIPEIREFYRSTEGFAKYDNFSRGSWAAGKVGFKGPIRRLLETDTFLVKTDPETESPYRDPKTGFCVKAKLGEVGEVIGKVKDRGVLIEYLNNSPATEEKIIFDVFKKGDCWQKMGDLLFMDRDGWVHFHDRMGDTFRWKGENVSAGEVRDHLAKLDEVLDAMVYGVKLPGYDGQAGAAAITLDSQTDEAFMKGLYSRLKKTGLPGYAMPRLVRITPEIEANATFKKSKGDLLKRSWIATDAGNQDKLYWLNGTSYQKLDASSWSSIEAGRAKL
ncbi:hypothetical protein G7Y89_g6166 [Cudoniella acicularis]|uniref:AMP-dependent synthetase/ligase domain-containing protein n=1 Tax=Cudoniella acicularis TaxID=354080 RepID=A0A8H4W2P9_9HELO|nr:hypothetical protein G7Y89_g6166 [Cudoniella acicularis]